MAELLIDIDGAAWDEELARLGGHPWQSAHWGEAVRKVDGVVDHRLIASEQGQTTQMVRIERRYVRGIGSAAWIRRGPTSDAPCRRNTLLEPQIARWLREHGYSVAVASPWCRSDDVVEKLGEPEKRPRTIWVDLSGGQQAVWNNLKGNWRASVRRAERDGVRVATTLNPKRIAEYYDLCSRISQVKGFALRMSPKVIEHLVSLSLSKHLETKLFLATCKDQLAAGALVARCGNSIHYLSGGTNRGFSPSRPAEALHWEIMQWALSKGCRLYELEGIDPESNPGVYTFKKKMGGEVVTLVSRQIEPLNVLGWVVAPLARTVLNSDLAALPALSRLAFTR